MKSKYEQVAQAIEERIKSRDYAPDAFLPSERELSYEFSVSRITVRLGLNQLKQQRLVTSVPCKGYRVAVSGGAPRPPLTHFVAGLFASTRNVVSTGPMSETMSRVLEASGFHLVYSSSEDILRSEVARIRALLHKKVDGLIIQPAFRKTSESLKRDDLGNHDSLKRLYDTGIPIVLVDRSFGAHGIPCVCNDERAGGYMATEYLLKRGHRHVIYFASTNDRIGRLRHQGFLDAMNDYEATPSEHLLNHLSIGSVVTNDESALRETRTLLTTLHGATAIVTAGRFPLNLGMLTRSVDYHGPPLEWIGYDFGPRDSGGEQSPFPYVKRPMEQIGQRAARKMLALVRGDKSAATEEYIKPEIIEPDRRKGEV